MPVVSVSGRPAPEIYAPTLMLGRPWPGMQGGLALNGHPVSRWAYHGRELNLGDRVWPRTSPRLAREPVPCVAPLHPSLPPINLAYGVPEGREPVDPEVGSARGSSPGCLVLVPPTGPAVAPGLVSPPSGGVGL
jgi:hypothetical protein